MAFEPGQSGNIAGNPKGVFNAKTLAKRLTVEALNVLSCIQTDTTAPVQTRLEAAREILNFNSNKEVIL